MSDWLFNTPVWHHSVVILSCSLSTCLPLSRTKPAQGKCVARSTECCDMILAVFREHETITVKRT